MEEFEEYTVTIINWEKFNPRRDVTNCSWFRMENSFYRSLTAFSMTASEKWVWVALLSIASERNQGSIKCSLSWLSSITGSQVRSLRTALSKLVRAGCIDVDPKLIVSENKKINKINTRKVSDVTSVPAGPEVTLAPADVHARYGTGRNVTIQDDLTKERKSGASLVPVPKQETSATPASPLGGASGKQASFLIAVYVKAWQARWGTKARPDLGSKSQGVLKRCIKGGDRTIEQLALMLQAYCQMDDKWFVTKTHDLITFEANLSKIALALDKGRSNPTERTWQDILAEEEAERAQRALRAPDSPA